MVLFEAIRDVLEKDEPKDDVLVLRRVHVAAELVGREPELAALTDAWLPTVFSRITAPASAPTVDLTIHFRSPPPQRPEPCLVVFRSWLATDGFFDEEGEVWSEDGSLLAQSRQLALVRLA